MSGLIDKSHGATNKLDLIDLKTGQELKLGWMDDIIDFNFGGDILLLSLDQSVTAPDGSGGGSAVPFTVELTGAPFGPIKFATANFHMPANVTVPIKDPMTKAMIGAYQTWGVPGYYFLSTNLIVIPLNKLVNGQSKAFKMTLAGPGYGDRFNITRKQTVYVPWDTGTLSNGYAFPGGDVDEFGNVYPIRSFGLNDNANACLIVPGSPGTAPFITNNSYGCWTTEAEAIQQVAALNIWEGAGHNYVYYPWDFWYTDWCGSSLLLNAFTYKAKDATTHKMVDLTGHVTPISSGSQIFQSGHARRTSSWGFNDGPTGNNGVGSSITVRGDVGTKKVTVTIP